MAHAVITRAESDVVYREMVIRSGWLVEVLVLVCFDVDVHMIRECPDPTDGCGAKIGDMRA